MDSRPLTQVGGDHIKAHIVNPSGASTECFVTDNADGTYQVEYTPFEKGESPSAGRAILGQLASSSRWLLLTPAPGALLKGNMTAFCPVVRLPIEPWACLSHCVIGRQEFGLCVTWTSCEVMAWSSRVECVYVLFYSVLRIKKKFKIR